METSATQAKSIEPKLAQPRSAWQDVLAETVVEVFSITLGAAVTVADTAPDMPLHLTGMVGIAGTIRANLILRCSQEAANLMASQMLGLAPNDPSCAEAARDALGELGNIIAGYFKAKIGYGEVCKLSVPMVVAGRDYHFHSRHIHQLLHVNIANQNHILQAVLEIAE